MELLKNVRTSIEHLVQSISVAHNVEVAIFDSSAELFCSTPIYYEKNGNTAHIPSVQEVLSSGGILVNIPGQMETCYKCRFRGHCPSKAEIYGGVKVQGTAIGAILITSFSNEGHNKIVNNVSVYKEAVTEFAFLLGEVTFNKTGHSIPLSIEHFLNAVMESSRNAMLMTDSNGIIMQYNSVAMNSLKFCKLSTSSLWHILPQEIVKKILKGVEFFDKNFEFEEYIAKLTNRIIYVEGKIVAIILQLFEIKTAGSKHKTALECIIGETEETKELQWKIRKLANSQSPVLILGETGTGKELTARAIHEQGDRKKFPFIAINCSSIPENLFESELFGYEEGSFTGAKKGGKKGKLELAMGGTVFFDELGDMPLSVQPKLLRVLQEYEIERVGSAKKIPLNIRIIAATNCDLDSMVEKKKFRSDLFYRVAVIKLCLPALRDRKRDIIPIARNYLYKLKDQIETPVVDFDKDVKNLFINYNWKGNIRELQNIVEYAVNFSERTLISVNDLPPEFILCDKKRQKENLKSISANEELEIMIDKYGYSLEGKKRISEELGISLRTLYRRLEKAKRN